MQAVASEVARFDRFDHDNGPYAEHDSGAFDHAGEGVFWKVDYYGPGMISGSEDPFDPGITRRVLTITLAPEY